MKLSHVMSRLGIALLTAEVDHVLNHAVDRLGMSLLTAEVNLRGGSGVFSIHAKNWTKNIVPHSEEARKRKCRSKRERGKDKGRGSLRT